jgi:hypothetical protein
MIAAQQESGPAGMPDSEVQQSGRRGILRDEKMKRRLRQHPQRDAPKL